MLLKRMLPLLYQRKQIIRKGKVREKEKAREKMLLKRK
jgi:hypothetical protein